MHWINYNHLYYFWILNQEGSFTRAAQKLSISQSTVSEQIRLLEEQLDTKLVDRSQKRVFRLTESGLVALNYANQIFTTGQELIQNLKGTGRENRRRLRVGVVSGLSRYFQIEFLRPILDQPSIRLEVTAGDQIRLLKLIKDYALDLVLTSQQLHREAGDDHYCHVLSESPLVAVCDYKLPDPKESVKKLLSLRSLYLPSLSMEARISLDAFFERQKISPTIAGEIDDIALLRLLALESKSLVIIPKLGVMNEISQKKVRVLYEFKSVSQIYYAITRQRRFPDATTADLITRMQDLHS